MTAKKNNKRALTLAVFGVALSLFVLVSSGYFFLDTASEVALARDYYREAKTELEEEGAKDGEAQSALGTSGNPRWVAGEEDRIAWLSCPGTILDYPVMAARDYNEYIYTLPNGTPSAYGSLFLEPLHKRDFSGRLSIIYGHNMYSDEMFGLLARYKDPAFFKEHPTMYLSTPLDEYEVRLHYGFVIDTFTWVRQGFIHEENLEELIDFAQTRTTFISEEPLDETERFLVLSTCSTESYESRYVVVGTLSSLLHVSEGAEVRGEA